MYADMIYKFGYVHCDPHAGNILVRKNDTGTDEIVLLDHGLYTVRKAGKNLHTNEP
jgi:aarF domain-containing kinase